VVDDASGREQLLVGDPPPFDAEAFAALAALLGERPPRALNVLQRKRLSTGLSQDELATHVGVSRQTISAIENRRRTPSVRLALTIATALNATVEELFAADELS
jgi:putative transcriptional regulator